jgi:hypothetical protein
MSESQFVIEEVTDPDEIARLTAQDERARRNGHWLESHWADLLPAVRGKHLAVAGEEAFVADSAEQAIALARTAHPEDDGLLVQYVRTERGPRIYASRRRMDGV